MKHNRFAANSFFFSANERIEIREAFVNSKSTKNELFFDYFLHGFCRIFRKSRNAHKH